VIYRAYLTANPGSPIALHAIRQIAGWDIKADEVEPLFSLLPEKTKNLPSAKDLMQKVTIARKTGIGQQAMDFTQNDTSGNPVTLSSFRGNYVLIDFWASWCGPCRAENPNVVKAYEQYKGKGFQVIGISLDQANARDKWLKAIHEDQLTWTQVSDLKFWKNAVAVQYGIQAIPQNFLIDPAGKIIAKNLRGEDLVAKLERIFK
jgi:peroxiredoxin